MKKIFFLLFALPLMLVSCGSDDDDDDLEQTLEINLNVGEKYSLPQGNYTIVIEPNKFIAKIDENGKVTGVHAGTTTATVQNGKTTYNCKIEIKANTTLYIDCDIYLGLKKSEIIKLFGDPISSNKKTYYFKGIGLEKQIYFSFDKNDIVEWAGIDFASSNASLVGKHLADRYVLLTTSKGTLLYSDTYDYKEKNGLLIYVEPGSKVISIIYIRYNTLQD